MEVEQLFASPLAYSFYPKEYSLTDYCYELMESKEKGGEHWGERPFNTHATYEIHTDPKFRDISEWVHRQVQEFAHGLGYSSEVYCAHSWVNMYEKGDSQEYHTHADSHFSCVFFLESEKDDAKFVFHNFNSSMIFYKKLEGQDNLINSSSVSYHPDKGKLLIFRSDAVHMVERKVTDSPRITLAYNFKQI